MAFTFDATLKDMGRDSPQGFVAAFDRPTTRPVQSLTPDLSTVTTLTDLVLGIGDPLEEILQMDFQTSAAVDKDADLLVYNSLLFRNYRVPVHTILVLLRPKAAHSRVNGTITDAPRPSCGKMNFRYEIVRLWEHPAEEFLKGESVGCRKAKIWRTD